MKFAAVNLDFLVNDFFDAALLANNLYFFSMSELWHRYLSHSIFCVTISTTIILRYSHALMAISPISIFFSVVAESL